MRPLLASWRQPFPSTSTNLIHGRVDKIIAFASVAITVKSKIADFKGYVNFQKLMIFGTRALN
jgi:hypothetical protein